MPVYTRAAPGLETGRMTMDRDSRRPRERRRSLSGSKRSAGTVDRNALRYSKMQLTNTFKRTTWTERDLNPRPLPCQGSDLPLIYRPLLPYNVDRDPIKRIGAGRSPIPPRRGPKAGIPPAPAHRPCSGARRRRRARYSGRGAASHPPAQGRRGGA